MYLGGSTCPTSVVWLDVRPQSQAVPQDDLYVLCWAALFTFHSSAFLQAEVRREGEVGVRSMALMSGCSADS